MLLAYKTQEQELEVLNRDWCDCRRCPLGRLAYKHVLYQAVPPHTSHTDVMFIGEGPGNSEDTIGKPFIGPAGRLLRRTVTRADGDDLKIVYTNLVACKPQDVRAIAFRGPNVGEIEACRPRLMRVIELFEPNIIVLLGRVPQEHSYAAIQMCRHSPCEIVEATHPSAVERSGGDRSPIYTGYVEQFERVFDMARELRS